MLDLKYINAEKQRKYDKTFIFLIKNEVSGIEKSNTNRSKIDKTMNARWG